MASETIVELIDSLTSDEQEAVREFVHFLKNQNACPSSPFLAAVHEFIGQHPELLRRLGQ